jgi:hypothetical protein
MKRSLLLKEIRKREPFLSDMVKNMIFMKIQKPEYIEQIPRHSDIEENLARNIIKHFS